MNIALSLADMSAIIAFVALCISTGTAAWGIFTSGHKQHAKDIAALKETAIATTHKVEKLEMAVKSLPDADSLHRMELSISEMRGDMKAMRAGLVPVQTMAESLTAMLIENAKGAKK